MILAVLVLVLVSCAVVGSFLSTSSRDLHQTRMALDYQKACIAAEAGLDYGVMKLHDLVAHYRLSPHLSRSELQGLLDQLPSPPSPMGDYVYQTPAGSSAFRITVDSSVCSGTITNGTTCRGADGVFQYFTITCGARNPLSGQGAVLTQRVQALSVFVIRYGVFYDEDLEILPGPTMYFYGRVHCNADMYVGSDGNTLQFFDRVTAHGDIFHRRKDSAARPGEALIEDASGTLQTMKIGGAYGFLDSDHPEWMAQSLTRWQGNVMSRAHGIARLTPPIDPMDAPHDVIERPLDPTDVAYHVETETEKFANKAALRIYVNAAKTVAVTDYRGNNRSSSLTPATLIVSGTDSTTGKPLYSKDANGQYLMSLSGVYDVNQVNFFDAREQCYMAPVDLYIDQLLTTYPALYDGTYSAAEGRGVVYVTRDDPDGAGTGVKPCVRIRNGQSILPYLGLSVVTDLPVYIEGNFNTQGTRKPAMVAGDALTLLSRDWQDARSTRDQNGRLPSDTTYNVVAMTGNSETAWGTYNGGLENVLRFLEHWYTSPRKTVTFRGSVIDLWQAESADGLWHYDSGPSTLGVAFRYTAPTRDWGYDEIYRLQNPPGMTRVFGMEEIEWSRGTWADVGW